MSEMYFIKAEDDMTLFSVLYDCVIGVTVGVKETLLAESEEMHAQALILDFSEEEGVVPHPSSEYLRKDEGKDEQLSTRIVEQVKYWNQGIFWRKPWNRIRESTSAGLMSSSKYMKMHLGVAINNQ